MEDTPNVSKKKWYKSTPILSIIFVSLLIGTYQAGYASGKRGFVYDPKEFKVVGQNEQVKDVDYSMYWDVLEVLDKKYIEKPINQEEAMVGAIRGALAATTDQYTQYFSKKELTDFKSELRGNFEGIGAQVDKKNNYIVIVAPIEDSPAERAGLRAGDYIIEVEGTSTSGMSVEEAVNKIRGKGGTKVKLKILREAQKQPFDVEIVRATINIKSVKLLVKEVEVSSGKKTKVGVITISRFGDDTLSLLDNVITEIHKQNIDKVIVDVRNDPGGYLETAVQVASQWIEKGKLIVKEEYSDRPVEEFNSKGYGRMQGMKTIVLINGGSASASEILAGALKDHGAASLIGEKSFGKGSVQELIDLPEGNAVKVTVAKWVTPGGKNLNKEGLTPDIEVKLTEEDFANKKDPQLDRALEEIVK
ncbi:MAG TPA: S41 family peptidase [Patescibacteria group bacterium]|nr:S41 family peptidase [Patescibacteria group bacterium]